MKESPVETLAPFGPNRGTRRKLPARLNRAETPFVMMNQYVFFEKSIPLATTIVIVTITG